MRAGVGKGLPRGKGVGQRVRRGSRRSSLWGSWRQDGDGARDRKGSIDGFNGGGELVRVFTCVHGVEGGPSSPLPKFFHPVAIASAAHTSRHNTHFTAQGGRGVQEAPDAVHAAQ
jgi:hypothetical protein